MRSHPKVCCRTDCGSAIKAIRAYRSWLWRVSNGDDTRRGDQDFPCDSFILRPKTPTQPPLLLLGGMGPLAGAAAFEQACDCFGNDRLIVLYQACSIRDRTEVIRRVLESGSRGEAIELVDELVAALGNAVSQLDGEICPDELHEPHPVQVDCVLVCNSMHYFLPLVRQRIHEARQRGLERLRFVSIIEAAVSRQTAGSPVLLATTTGALLCGSYADALRKAGVPYILPSDAAQAELMRGIYQGVKAFNPRVARDAGTEFLRLVLRKTAPVSAMIAACTEIPIMLSLVGHETAAAIQQFVQSKRMVDPVICVLEQLRDERREAVAFPAGLREG